MKTRLRSFATLAASAAVLGACASQPLSPGVDWVINSTGPQSWAAEAETVYDRATAYVTEVAADRAPETWVVVFDLDETVMNNVAYQAGLERRGESYSSDSWHDWTQTGQATLVPGAKGFIDDINASGGFVAFVTNRSDRDQLATEINLEKLGLKRGRDFRVLLTKASPKGDSNKTPRYNLIGPLLAAQGYPGTEIIAFIGDNIGDQPEDLGRASFFCIDQGAMYGDPCAQVPGPGE